MLVKQVALSEEGYNYWLNLYKTTENVGGLFDPMPGQVIGNIVNVQDPSEIVVGFFSAATVQEQRIFIDKDDLPERYSTYLSPQCLIDSIMLEDLRKYPDTKLLISTIYSQGGFPVLLGYTSTENSCIDCRTYGGGKLEKPDFWP
jgi:hypothetical protein